MTDDIFGIDGAYQHNRALRGLRNGHSHFGFIFVTPFRRRFCTLVLVFLLFRHERPEDRRMTTSMFQRFATAIVMMLSPTLLLCRNAPRSFTQAFSFSSSSSRQRSSTPTDNFPPVAKGKMTSSSARRRRLIVDTDAGFDDVVAIQCLVAHGIPVDLVTTVCGSNTASQTCQSLQRLVPELGGRIVASPNRLDRPTQAWLTDFRRRFAAFVEQYTAPQTDEDRKKQAPGDSTSTTTHDDATTRVRNLLVNTPDDDPVDLLCLGPLSNIADWCRTFPNLLQSKVSDVWILGGAHPDARRTDEFNFGQDAAAAHCVVETLGAKIHLVPGDVTAHTCVSDAFIETIVQEAARQHKPTLGNESSSSSSSSSNLLAHVVQEEQYYSIFYDPVCVFLYLHQEAADFSRIPLHVCPETGVVSQRPEESLSAAPAIPVVRRVDFGAYQTWLLQAMRQSSAT